MIHNILPLSFTLPESGGRAEQALGDILGLVLGDDSQALLQSAGGPSILASMSHTINGLALFAATILVLWSSLSAVASTAHEGVLFGRRYHGMWVPLRSALAISMLLPLVSGYSLIQTGVVLLAGLGFKSADLAWQAALGHLQNSGPVIAISPAHGAELSEALFKSNLCMLRLNSLYLDGEQSLKIVVGKSEGETSKQRRYYRLSFDGVPGSGLGRGKCGEFTLDHERGPIGDAMHEGGKAALLRLSARLNAVARGLLGGTLSNQQAARQLRQARAGYASDIRATASHALSHGEDAISRSNRQFFNTAEQEGWMMAGAWFWTLSAVNRRIADTVQNAPGVKLPNPDNMPSDWQLALSQDLLRTERTVISKLHEAASAGARAEGYGGLHDKVAGWSNQAMILVLDYVNTLFNSKGEPVVALQSFGHGVITASRLMISGAIIGQAAGTGALEGARGNLLARAADTLTLGGKLDFLRSVGSILLEWASLLVVVLAAPVLLAGLTLAFWLPAAPFIYWFSGIIAWLVSLLEALFVAPLWAAAHAGLEGEGFAGYYARAGYMLLLALIARPLMMVLALFSAMLVVRYGSQFLLYTFTPFVRGMHAQTITGIISLIVMLLLLTVLVVAMANRAYSLIHVLPETILRYISEFPGTPAGSSLASDAQSGFAQGMQSARAPIAERLDASGPGPATQAPSAQGDADALSPGIIIARDIPDKPVPKA